MRNAQPAVTRRLDAFVSELTTAPGFGRWTMIVRAIMEARRAEALVKEGAADALRYRAELANLVWFLQRGIASARRPGGVSDDEIRLYVGLARRLAGSGDLDAERSAAVEAWLGTRSPERVA